MNKLVSDWVNLKRKRVYFKLGESSSFAFNSRGASSGSVSVVRWDMREEGQPEYQCFELYISRIERLARAKFIDSLQSPAQSRPSDFWAILVGCGQFFGLFG
jgi:hypothetical protein